MSANPLTRYLSEFIGTCLLVLMGCGCAVFAGADVGFVGVALPLGAGQNAACFALDIDARQLAKTQRRHEVMNRVDAHFIRQ